MPKFIAKFHFLLNLPDFTRQSRNTVRLHRASMRGSILEVLRDTKHMSTSEVSEPKPDIVEPTK